MATWLVLATRCCKRSLEKLILIDRFGAASSFGIQRQVELSGVTGVRQEPEREPGSRHAGSPCDVHASLTEGRCVFVRPVQLNGAANRGEKGPRVSARL